MNARNAWRGTPAFCARIVTSASDCVTTPSRTLWQILTIRDSSLSPTYDAPAPIVCNSGSTSRYTASGPEHTNESFPAFTTLALPDTGAASIAQPRRPRSARSSADPSTEIDEHSTRIRGTRAPDSRPSGPAMTERTSSHVDTMQNTTSQPASSASVDATVAPYGTSGSALARVRFQIFTALPDCASRFAISKPIRPAPIQPMLIALIVLVLIVVLIAFVLIVLSPCCLRTDSRSAALRPETAR